MGKVGKSGIWISVAILLVLTTPSVLATRGVFLWGVSAGTDCNTTWYGGGSSGANEWTQGADTSSVGASGSDVNAVMCAHDSTQVDKWVCVADDDADDTNTFDYQFTSAGTWTTQTELSTDCGEPDNIERCSVIFAEEGNSTNDQDIIVVYIPYFGASTYGNVSWRKFNKTDGTWLAKKNITAGMSRTTGVPYFCGVSISDEKAIIGAGKVANGTYGILWNGSEFNITWLSSVQDTSTTASYHAGCDVYWDKPTNTPWIVYSKDTSPTPYVRFYNFTANDWDAEYAALKCNASDDDIVTMALDGKGGDLVLGMGTDSLNPSFCGCDNCAGNKYNWGNSAGANTGDLGSTAVAGNLVDAVCETTATTAPNNCIGVYRGGASTLGFTLWNGTGWGVWNGTHDAVNTTLYIDAAIGAQLKLFPDPVSNDIMLFTQESTPVATSYKWDGERWLTGTYYLMANRMIGEATHNYNFWFIWRKNEGPIIHYVGHNLTNTHPFINSTGTGSVMISFYTTAAQGVETAILSVNQTGTWDNVSTISSIGGKEEYYGTFNYTINATTYFKIFVLDRRGRGTNSSFTYSGSSGGSNVLGPLNLDPSFYVDTYLDGDASEEYENNGADVVLRTSDDNIVLFWFNMTELGIPEGANFVNTSIWIDDTGGSATTIYATIKHILSSWREGIGVGSPNSAIVNGASWYTRYYNVNWTTAGGDLAPGNCSSDNIYTSDWLFEFTECMKNVSADHSTFYGFAINTSTPSYYRDAGSSESTSNRPRLNVSWTYEAKIKLADISPPSAPSNFKNYTGYNWIYWNWTEPSDYAGLSWEVSWWNGSMFGILNSGSDYGDGIPSGTNYFNLTNLQRNGTYNFTIYETYDSAGNKNYTVLSMVSNVTIWTRGSVSVDVAAPSTGATEYINQTMWLNLTITCNNNYCGEVWGYVRYNKSSANPDTLVSNVSTDLPLGTWWKDTDRHLYQLMDFLGINGPGSASKKWNGTNMNVTSTGVAALPQNFTWIADEVESADTMSCESRYAAIMHDVKYPGWVFCTGGYRIQRAQFDISRYGIDYKDVMNITYMGRVFSAKSCQLSWWNYTAGNWTKIANKTNDATNGILENYTAAASTPMNVIGTNGVVVFYVNSTPADTSDCDMAFQQLNVTTRYMSCGFMNKGDTCLLNFSINATQTGNYSIDAKIMWDYGLANNNSADIAINVTRAPDNILPWLTMNRTNATVGYPKYGGGIQFNFTVNDNVGVNSYIVSHNITGTWTNETGVLVASNPTSAIILYNKSIGNYGRRLVGWKVFLNDTSNRWNGSDEIWVFNISNTAPTGVGNTYLVPWNSTLSTLWNCSWNGTVTDVDGDFYSFYYDWWNGTYQKVSDIGPTGWKYSYRAGAGQTWDGVDIFPNNTVIATLEVATYRSISFNRSSDGSTLSNISGTNLATARSVRITNDSLMYVLSDPSSSCAIFGYNQTSPNGLNITYNLWTAPIPTQDCNSIVVLPNMTAWILVDDNTDYWVYKIWLNNTDGTVNQIRIWNFTSITPFEIDYDGRFFYIGNDAGMIYKYYIENEVWVLVGSADISRYLGGFGFGVAGGWGTADGQHFAILTDTGAYSNVTTYGLEFGNASNPNSTVLSAPFVNWATAGSNITCAAKFWDGYDMGRSSNATEASWLAMGGVAISSIPDIYNAFDEPLDYTVTCSGGDGSYVWYDNTSLFNIGADGRIQDSPTREEVGSYPITITCDDETGNNASDVFIYNIRCCGMHVNTTMATWSITTARSCQNCSVAAYTNCTIENGGSLTLKNVTWITNATLDDNANITVRSGGALYIYNSNYTSNLSSIQSSIVIQDGGYFRAINNSMADLGSGTSGSCGLNGFVINADNSYVDNLNISRTSQMCYNNAQNSTLKNVLVYGPGWRTDAIVLRGTSDHTLIDTVNVSYLLDVTASSGIATYNIQDNITIQNSVLDGHSGSALYITSGKNWKIINNKFRHGNRTAISQAIAVALTGSLNSSNISNNVFYNWSNFSQPTVGIHLGYFNNFSNNYWQTNPNGTAGSGWNGSYGLLLWDSGNNTLRNNTFQECKILGKNAGAVWLWNNSQFNRFYDTTINDTYLCLIFYTDMAAYRPDNNYFENTICQNASSADVAVYFKNGGINTTFLNYTDPYTDFYHAGTNGWNVYLEWYVKVYANDSVGNALVGGNITINDSKLSPRNTFEDMIDAVGFSAMFNLTEMNMSNTSATSSTNKELYSNFSVKVSSGNYVVNWVHNLSEDPDLPQKHIRTIIWTVTLDRLPPQYWQNSTNRTTASKNVTFAYNWTEEYNGLSMYVFSWNNSGEWQNITAPLSGRYNWTNQTQTLNSTVGLVVGWKYFVNDSFNNWNVTPEQSFIILNPNSPPLYRKGNTSNSTAGGSVVEVSWNWTDYDGGLSYFILSHNNSGTWQNATATAFPSQSNYSWSNSTFKLNATGVVGWKYFANDSEDAWNVTSENIIVIVSANTAPSVKNITISPDDDGDTDGVQVTPNEDTWKVVTFTFNVTDEDGWDDIVIANISITNYSISVSNSSCRNTSCEGNLCMFHCTISMNYSLSASSWNANCTAYDSIASDFENLTFDYSLLSTIKLLNNSIDYGLLMPSATNETPAVMLSNSGNDLFYINMTGANLVGVNFSGTIMANNFKWDTSGSPSTGTTMTTTPDAQIDSEFPGGDLVKVYYYVNVPTALRDYYNATYTFAGVSII